MTKIIYLIGMLRHIFNTRISKLALIDNLSSFHKAAKVYRNVKVVNSCIGAYTYVAPGTQLLWVNVGRFCSIGPNCLIGLPEHPINNISTSPIFTSQNNALKIAWAKNDTFEEFKRVQIGNDVWIGARAIVMGNLKIGHGAIIGAGSIVTKDVPDYAIVVGVPARIIRYRFNESIIEKLLEVKWWNKPERVLKGRIEIFGKDNINGQDLDVTFCKE